MIEGKQIILLIGVDVPEVFWVLEERRGRRKEPYAIRSILGWTLIGPIKVNEGQSSFHTHYVKHEDTLLERQVKRFWENDMGDLMIDIQERESIEDRRAKSIMEKSFVKVDGHYQMGLPWHHGEPVFPINSPYVEARLRLLKKRFEKDSELYTNYKETIDDYLEKGYAREVPYDSQGVLQGSNDKSSLLRDTGQSENQAKVWYLPHHPVFHPQKPGKVRVVFDCTARFKGTSLNDQLLRGPDFTNNLVGVLSRFIIEPIAMTAEIEAMFHQPEETWPTPPVVLGNDPKLDTDPEVKGTARVRLIEATGPLDEFLLRYSSWSKLLKGVAWILRIRRYLYHRVKGEIESTNSNIGGLDVKDIREAERGVVKYVQSQCFQPIIDYLKSQSKGVYKRCKFKTIRKLNPILIDGVLRVGGRLENAPLADDVKHPIILPSMHHVTDLVIEHHHLLVGHSGAGSTWSSLREKYWGGVSVRRVIASHMGGVWERVIRSVRKILKNLRGEQIVNDEVLLTVMAEVESILNSRPLTQLSLDPRDI
ncbi:hypothetical protein HOLleu_22626 [Holothuria leucospilota]|uniref:Integrase zinc-binding domain-containing protein n=1 Tax=Holothuria leucospilota TaxID=206669 RepID=A0A9Q1BXV6_HOLLE|nr:hypothetical protein HOLleu_22626 [Holothuria leucospilota]